MRKRYATPPHRNGRKSKSMSAEIRPKCCENRAPAQGGIRCLPIICPVPKTEQMMRKIVKTPLKIHVEEEIE